MAVSARATRVALLALLVTACAGGAPGTAEAPGPLDTAAPPGAAAGDAASPEATVPVPATTSTAVPCDDPLGCYGQPRRVGEFDAEAVPEASGLAASRRNPDVLYLLDDRPRTDAVWAIGTDGAMLGAIAVAGLDARDTEALAVGPCGRDDPAPCVYVGDIGDNLRARADVAVHRFPEPDLGAGVPETVEADVARLTYPDGAHDAEALLVDDVGAVLIVTKAPFDAETGETGDARLYRAVRFRDGVLEDLGPVRVAPPDAPLQSRLVGNVVTGGDYRDGRVLLRTYDQVLEYHAAVEGADVASFPDWPVRRLPAPVEPQAEAIAWARDGCGYYTAGEVVGDLWYVPCR